MRDPPTTAIEGAVGPVGGMVEPPWLDGMTRQRTSFVRDGEANCHDPSVTYGASPACPVV